MKREDYDFTKALVDDVAGMKIGIPRDYFGEGLGTGGKNSSFAGSRGY